jgi:hypothetical protein
MSLLKTETPSTPDVIEDEQDAQHDVLQPDQPKRTKEREEITSTGSILDELAGNTRQQETIHEDWEAESMVTEVEEDQSEDLEARLGVTWRRFGVHKRHRQESIINASHEIMRKFCENEGKGEEMSDKRYADELVAVATSLATKYELCVRAKGSRPSMRMSLNLLEPGEWKGSPLNPIRRYADEWKRAEAAEKGKNREINEPMAQEEEQTPGQYHRKAPETPANQDEERTGPGSSLSSVTSSSGISEPIPPHVLPPRNWHARVNNQRARDGEVREKGYSIIEDQGVRFRDHTPYDMWANPMGTVYVGPGLKEESVEGSVRGRPNAQHIHERESERNSSLRGGSAQKPS